jgi:hypothetical protein
MVNINTRQLSNNDNGNNYSKNFLIYMFQTFKLPSPSIKYKYTSTKEIEGIIKSLKTKESHGCQEIPTKILKSSAPLLSAPH